MRILMLAQFYPPTIGGEEHQVRHLSLELAKRGHEVAVATFWRQGLAERETDGGVQIYRIPSTVQRMAGLFSDSERRHAPPFPDPEATVALSKVMREYRPDIVHAHNWLVHSFLPLKAWSGARLILALHDYSLACTQKRLMYRGMPCSGPSAKKCFDCASVHYGAVKGVTSVLGHRAMQSVERKTVDLFLPVSQAVAVGNGLVASHAPFQVVPNFLPDDLNVHRYDAQSFLDQLPQEDFLLFVGDLGHDKGLNVLLKAYAGLVDAPPLVLIGRAYGDTPTEFPPNVHVFKSWPHYAVMQAWRRSLLALAPSIWPEPFGLVVIEAMANGRPVIASRTGGLTDIVVDGETGLLVIPNDVASLRQAIARLLAEPALRTAMGQAGKRRFALYQASSVVPLVEQVYQKLMHTDSYRQAIPNTRGWASNDG